MMIIKKLNKINLNKVRVDNIFKNYIIDKEFNRYVQFYIESLNKFFCEDIKTINIFRKLNEINFIEPLRYRVKSTDSINGKLNSYTCKKECGKIKIKKCLNNLFGMKIVIII